MHTKTSFIWLAVIILLMLTACSSGLQTGQIPTNPVIDTDTPAPSKPAATPTATSVPPTEAPAPALASVQMLTAEAGWAWSTDGRLMHTVDGGITWTDRTPLGFQFSDSGYFLDAQTAWLPFYSDANSRFELLHTTDGGQSWAEYPQGPASGLHFSDPLNGWSVSGDVGAGNVYFYLSQTDDGGKTWATIPAKAPEPEADLPAGTIHLCNICNDAFYYDSQRMVIIYGDLGSMQPGGAVSVDVSFDLGNTWKKQSLALPQGEADALVSPNLPTFFNDKDGILPIHLIKMKPDGSYSEQKMIFYATSDGGASWSVLPTILDAVPLFRSIQVSQSQDIFVICGSALCVSHDKAQTWQTISSDMDFSTTDTRSISVIDFVNGSTGWVLVNDNETSSLHATVDGGVHWTEINPMLAPSLPPKITVDTSIPTPTTVPTPTQEPTPTPNVAYDPQAQADRITFAPYTTWVELNSTATANTTRRYVLSAMQYQTMSVSISQGPAFSVEVAGADKKTLTDVNNPHPYWRGVLPSTQDYYVTVMSQVDGPFTLRIAINPPGLSSQYFVYVDPQYHVELDYPDEFAPVSWQLPIPTRGTPLLTLYFIEPSYYYPATNLNEATLQLAASSDPGVVSTCTQPAPGSGETVSGEVTVNGYTFTRSEFVGAAAGNRYDQIFYRTVTQGTCFEVIFLIHSAEIGNYPPGTVVEFDRERLLHQFESVLDTFITK